MQQGSAEWLELRKGYIGASDASIIMKVSPWCTPFELWEQKLGLAGAQKDSFAMKYGRDNEEAARCAYEKYTNNLVAPEIVFHPEHKFMMASLDGLSINGDVIVEIKNANRSDHELAKNGKIPEKYYPQLQHQLDCLPGAILHYWSFNNGEGVLVEVDRCSKYTKILIKEEKSFWEKITGFETPELMERDYLDLNNNEEWVFLTNEAREIAKLEKELQLRKESNRSKLKDQSQGRSSKGNGVKFTRSFPKGRIDYELIPEIKGVDLESYRKPSTARWSMSFNIEKERTEN